MGRPNQMDVNIQKLPLKLNYLKIEKSMT